MKKIIISSVMWILLILTFQNLAAQDLPLTQESEKVDRSESDLIPVVQIPQKIEELYVVLKKINSVEIPSIEIEKIEENFQNYLDEIKQLKKESTKETFENLPSKKLKDNNIKWNTYLIFIENLKIRLQDDSESLAESKERMGTILAGWEKTNSNAKKEKAPKLILNNLRDFKREVLKTEKDLNKVLNRVLSIRDKVSTEEIAINEILTLIKNQLEENRSLIFTFDSSPIWVSLADSSDTTSFMGSIDKSSSRVSSSIVEFWDMYSEEFPYYIGFYFFVLLIIFYLKRFGNKIVGENAVESEIHSMNILNKPFSIAALITIYFHLAFFPHAPTVITEIARIILVVPIILLFPTFISRVSRGPLYYVTSIYLLQQMIELFMGASIYSRVVTILLTLMMISALFWFLKIDINKINKKRIKIATKIQFLIKFLLVLLFVSLIGNVIGNTALSTLIFSGIIRTIYGSFILITSLQVFYSLLTILLETRLAKISYIVQRNADIFKSTLFKIVNVIAAFFWFGVVLRNFEIYDSISDSLISTFTTPLEFGDISIVPLNIVLFFVSIWMSLKLSKFIRFFFENEIFARVKLPRGVPAAISIMLNYALITIGFLIALSFLGFSVEKFAIIFGALGVGIGFGLQSIVNNFISGLILLFERPIQVGDTISLPTNNLLGTVKRIGIRASVVATFDGSEVIVPNADLISGQVTNWTLSDYLRRIEIKIGVHFNANPNEVMDILNKAIEGREDLLKDPKPYILYKGYGDDRQNFDLRFWTANSGDWIFIRSDVLLKITKMLNDAGIEIPYPQQNVYLNEMEKKKVKTKK